MGKDGSRLRGAKRGSENVRTVAVTVMCCHFLAYCDRLDHAEGDVAPFAKKFAIVITVMLSFISRENEGQGNVA
jgi:hypothetical protein